jgi:hypothetical protein
MTDEELCKRLRNWGRRTPSAAADRIEELIDKLAKAMSIAKRVTSFEDDTQELAECGCARCKAHLDLRTALAEIEGEKG